uniref:Putative secreted peptide n=1 Tax=Anopheles braziliensis TaxID=58242 RepID=A0A2M3ZSK2_9DIPT
MFRLRSVLAFTTGFALLRCVIPSLNRIWFRVEKGATLEWTQRGRRQSNALQCLFKLVHHLPHASLNR